MSIGQPSYCFIFGTCSCRSWTEKIVDIAASRRLKVLNHVYNDWSVNPGTIRFDQWDTMANVQRIMSSKCRTVRKESPASKSLKASLIRVNGKLWVMNSSTSKSCTWTSSTPSVNESGMFPFCWYHNLQMMVVRYNDIPGFEVQASHKWCIYNGFVTYTWASTIDNVMQEQISYKFNVKIVLGIITTKKEKMMCFFPIIESNSCFAICP